MLGLMAITKENTIVKLPKFKGKWKSSDKKNCFQGCPLFIRVGSISSITYKIQNKEYKLIHAFRNILSIHLTVEDLHQN